MTKEKPSIASVKKTLLLIVVTIVLVDYSVESLISNWMSGSSAISIILWAVFSFVALSSLIVSLQNYLRERRRLQQFQDNMQ